MEKAESFDAKAAKASRSSQLKGFKHSKPGLLISIGTSAFGAVGVVKDIRKSRSEGDTLKLVNAAVAALAIVTSTALLVRELRRLGSDDVLAP
ncbi:hypothetical protein GXW83_28035 [Streptacidiphilus sp. PB12-B1b]|uniref:hypothetical protein n=1 Tax=Streptacidiphilus sp. PB12-B1b TaxID=2705012 RepID=UPI0015FCC998|nr:hypothetical protein [Streptacidiphilus sp. PB12-B1b]QMU80597.1 hypothetical protein GXW83_28035 [Streptacidiphilus sp. PB12-B1b]